MNISVFDLFSIGIGPSSSHTVGPMCAAREFAQLLDQQYLLESTGSLSIQLFGSLGATGRGHGTDKAVMVGLEGEDPETVEPAEILDRVAAIAQTGQLNLLGKKKLSFDESLHLQLLPDVSMEYHSNALQFTGYNAAGDELLSQIYYSIGGGFIVSQQQVDGPLQNIGESSQVPFPFTTMAELLQHCHHQQLPISGIMLCNEKVWRDEAAITAGLLNIWQVMRDSIHNGCHTEGYLPGGLMVKRRAPMMYRDLSEQREKALSDPLSTLDWVNLYAIAVNEENAAGGRVVTAPTNGAAGVIPAVLRYFERFNPMANDQGIVRFLLTAGAIGLLYKQNASISGAEVGCQGEVGSACSMAAGALTEVTGGSPAQVENAAEIAMEHNLGLTCDPIGGLVQVPCIERNAMAAIKAINAKRIALKGDGSHFVSLDKVIKTMHETGRDMQQKYKETSRGGLAVNVIEC